jgi:hypothetical protein
MFILKTLKVIYYPKQEYDVGEGINEWMAFIESTVGYK